jgi:hypothetical protein
VIIVTPAAGSVPEPRPQALITGDRAVVLVSDGGVTTTALVKAGVQIVTTSLSVYNELTSALAPEVSTDVDPGTGYIKAALLPPYLSAAAINALNVLDTSNHVADAYLPDRLSSASITALIASTSATQLDTDPDGTPVVLGNGVPGGTSATYTGTLTGATVNAGTLHGDVFTANVATIQANEVGTQLFDNQSVAPGTPAVGKITMYSDANSRPNFKDSLGTTYLVGNKRIVTAFPTTGMQLGDEAILSATGEHRIYKGATLGWRLASPHTVGSLADRNALAAYEGMRVYADFGVAQEHVYTGGQWRGTKAYPVQGGPVRYNQHVNDTNFRRWNETAITDPGYQYFLSGRLTLEVVQLGTRNRAEVWVSVCDQVTGANSHLIHQSYDDYWNGSGPNDNRYCRFDAAPMTPAGQVQAGNRLICVDWRVATNNANAYSGAYQAYNDWLVIPA